MRLRNNTEIAGTTAGEWKQWAQEKLKKQEGRRELDGLDRGLTTNIDSRLIGIIRGCRQAYYKNELGNNNGWLAVGLEESPLMVQLGNDPASFPVILKRLQRADEIFQRFGQTGELVVKEQGHSDLRRVLGTLWKRNHHGKYLSGLTRHCDIPSNGKYGREMVQKYSADLQEILETEDPFVIGGAAYYRNERALYEQKVLAKKAKISPSAVQKEAMRNTGKRLESVLQDYMAHPGCGEQILQGMQSMREALRQLYQKSE